MELWEGGTNYSGEKIPSLFVLGVVYSSFLPFNNCKSKTLFISCTQQEKKGGEGSLFCFYSNKLNAKLETHREEIAA